jgi:hypothetical protein
LDSCGILWRTCGAASIRMSCFQCCDHYFRRFLNDLRRKMAFFLKIDVWFQFLLNLAVFWVKNAVFFGEMYIF